MASGWGEGTVQPWRAPPLELTKWSKTTQEDMCVCVHVQGFALLFHVCNRLYTPSSLQFGYLLSRVHNGLYPVFLQLGAHHLHRVDRYLHT